MLRRSSSSSNIPLPKINLFGTKDRNSRNGRRSQSASRLSQRDSGMVTQFRHQRQTSLDRKSSTIGLLRTTPLHRIGARAGSLQRTTPSSAISQRTSCSRGTTPSSGRKDFVSIQKLSTDKKWVSDQFAKVQNFIMCSGLFELGVVDSSNIKPPSINNFIYVTGVLLMEIFPRIKISKENYKEVIPIHLKVLKYPGTLTNSVLKTVNTMHSWPQVIGMWSWLIDKVNFCRNFNDHSFADHLEPEERTKFFMKQNILDFFIKRYKIFNQNDSESEEIEAVNEAYLRNLYRSLDVDFETLKSLEADMAEKKEYRNKLETDVEQLKSERTRIESEMADMEEEIRQFNESDPIEEAELDTEIRLLLSNIQDLNEAKDAHEENIAGLQEAIEGQRCTYQEKVALLRQIGELEKEMALKREKIEHAKEIKNKFDHKLTSKISKVQSQAVQWNRSLMEASIKMPHLQRLLLREKRFHDPGFLEELQAVADVVENEMGERLEKIERDLRAVEDAYLETEKEIKELNGAVHRIEAECAEVSDSVEEVKTVISKIVEESESHKASLMQEMAHLQEENVSAAQAKTIRELKEKHEQLQEEVKKFRQKMLSFFVELHNQVLSNVKQMEGIRTKLVKNIEAKQMNAVQRQCQIIKVLKEFTKANK